MFRSAASSVVSVADFRTEKDGSETQEVCERPCPLRLSLPEPAGSAANAYSLLRAMHDGNRC